jgi:hypothetical protein
MAFDLLLSADELAEPLPEVEDGRVETCCVGPGDSGKMGELPNECDSMIGSWIFSCRDSGVRVAARSANSVSGLD